MHFYMKLFYAKLYPIIMDKMDEHLTKYNGRICSSTVNVLEDCTQI